MNIREAKEMDIVDYLSKLGLEPEKIKGADYWYLSPLGTEKNPSFKVNRNLNRWYDFREGKGGNLIDFGIAYFQCNISELLQKLSGSNVSIEPHKVHALKMKDVEKHSIEILSTHSISSYPLIKYLRSRKINGDIADSYCSEVRYKIGDKIFYALGFKNNSGGYELRNEKYKGSSSPKDVTSVNNGSKDLAVFEGFFDFLSYKTLFDKKGLESPNFLILNSTSFFEKSLPFMQGHRGVHLYLDTDKTGEKCTLRAVAVDNEKFHDERKLYHKYNDLNDWLMHCGQVQSQRLKQKP